MGGLLKELTTIGIGGRAKRVIVAKSRGTLIDNGVGSLVLGRGSNILASDDGYDGVVLVNRYSDISVRGDLVTAGSGARLSELVGIAAENSLGGMEWAVGIPASVGGAVVMNAGAFGGDISQVLEYADVLRDGNVIRLARDELKLGYRTSGLQYGDVVVDVAFRLRTADSRAVRALCESYTAKRRSRQPMGKSAGSVFKNPQGVSIGRMLDEMGFKGYSIGGASVSDMHANIIINRGNATARDVRAIIKTLKTALGERGVEAEEEIVYIGEFN